ncbi:hypothetical protein DVS28_b0483 (plasmid) [Euzebya pacifica]|uniref:Uncharacterized protein n=1 Tax=Euzebya pacifica TaxID=1608957 RepID=A0A346Y6X6_9ACTN|nr:hypothetical protein [Euzebya pacifica]AXV10223.1 hypothetical protein DVS28_b0483 [Euzebya pacifica]
MSGWGDEDDLEIDDAALDSAAGSGGIAMDADGFAEPAGQTPVPPHHTAGGNAGHTAPVGDHREQGDPGATAPVVSLRGHRHSVAADSQLVPTAVDDKTTRRARQYLERYAPTSSPGVNRAMSGLLHEIHTLTRNGAV